MKSSIRQDYLQGDLVESDEIFLILDGVVSVINTSKELAKIYDRGFIGLKHVFNDGSKWNDYEIICNTDLSLLKIDATNLSNIVNKYSELSVFLLNQAKQLDLILLHQKETENNLVSRVDLGRYAPSFQQILLESCLIKGSELFNKSDFLILYSGTLIHDSGKELLKGQVYNRSSLPENGEWLCLGNSCMYVHKKEEENEVQTSEDKSDEGGLTLDLEVFDREYDLKDEPAGVVKPSLADRLASFYQVWSSKLRLAWRKKLRAYPVYQQHGSNDCGAACLKMLGKYWGKDFDYSHLLKSTDADRSGSSLASLVNAGEQLGFSMYPGKTDLSGLESNDLPVIAHWEGNHFVVVYEISKTQVVISDPNIGKRSLARSSFCDGWTGYVLWAMPTSRLYQSGDKKVSFESFVELLKPYKRVLAEILAASIGIQFLSILIPISTQILLDKVVNQSYYSTFWAVGSGLMLAKLLREVTVSLRRYLFFHTGNKLDLTLVVGFIAHALKLPLKYYDSQYVGDIVSRMGENRKIRKFITGDAITTLIDTASIIIYLTLMFWYSAKLSLISLLIIPILLFTALISTSILMRQSREVFAASTREQSYLIEILTGIDTIKSMGLEKKIRWHWENFLNQYINLNFDAQMTRERFRILTVTGETIVLTTVFLVGIWQVMHQELSIGSLIAFNMLLAQVVEPFKRMNLLWHEFQEIRIAIERTEDVINSPVEQEAVGRLERIGKIESVEFSDVCFKYSSDSKDDILSEISFAMKPGQTIALVGKSGSGKSTIGKLLLGLYPATQGKIRINGIEIEEINFQSLRQKIGVVNQEVFMLGGTIWENLTIGHPNATAAEVKEVCDLACASDFIKSLPLKYDTKIGEGGSLLSGGQRQRLAIARALLGNPSLLIFDEATSSLDTESEKIIQSNLNNILSQQTTLVIAHRLSTIKQADQILVLDQGKIIEQGRHDELMQAEGYYFHLVNQQL